MKAVTSHVLPVEDDSQLAQLIAQELGCEGYQISLMEDGISDLIAAHQINPHLIIVGWILSGVSCIELCRRLRSTYNYVSIIVLTHKGQIAERVMGLDYIRYLRIKLEAHGAKQLIHTVRGIGYVLRL